MRWKYTQRLQNLHSPFNAIREFVSVTVSKNFTFLLRHSSAPSVNNLCNSGVNNSDLYCERYALEKKWWNVAATAARTFSTLLSWSDVTWYDAHSPVMIMNRTTWTSSARTAAAAAAIQLHILNVDYSLIAIFAPNANDIEWQSSAASDPAVQHIEQKSFWIIC